MLAYDGDGWPAAYGWRRNGELWIEVPAVARFHLPPNSTVVKAIAEDSVDPGTVLDAYYGAALPFMLQATHRLEVLHGSAVLLAPSGSVVAFCGVSESGKSTVAYGLTTRGYRHWADDGLAFRVNGARSVSTLGLPFTVKLREGSATYFQATGADAGSSADPLRVVHDYEWTTSRLGALFLLELRDPMRSSETAIRVERLEPGEALHALLPNAFRFQPQTVERRRETMRSYLELVASVPVFCALFSRRVDRLPELLDELEHRMHEVV